MRGITPHLWFADEAVEAAEFYTRTFEDSAITEVRTVRGTPSGDADIVSFVLCGQPFQAISAGPLFPFNPSVSFTVTCPTPERVDELWDTLGEGGGALLPLGAYPFSDRSGWTTDRYGLSWQITVAAGDVPRITPSLLFTGDVHGRAAEAVAFYVDTFPDSATDAVTLHGPEAGDDLAGTVAQARFRLAGQPFTATDGGPTHDFGFSEAISFLVSCDDQAEIDRYWEALSAVPEAEQCGWLEDRFGVSWQVVPAAMDTMMRSANEEQLARVTAAFLAMKKFDLAALQRAYDGG